LREARRVGAYPDGLEGIEVEDPELEVFNALGAQGAEASLDRKSVV
jgi:hypothetical protein